MDAFEKIVAKYCEEDGYWVKSSVKLDISKEDKRKMGTPSMPRPEIDLIVFKPIDNILMLVEVKSYLDSPGVKYNSVIGKNKKEAPRYRLFTDEKFRKRVTRQVKENISNLDLFIETLRLNIVLSREKYIHTMKIKFKSIL